MQSSETFSPLRVPSYLSHVHLPTLSVPTFLYSVGAVGPAAAPRPAIIASMRLRASGGMFFICSCICAIAPAICALIFSMSALVISV